MENWGGRIEQHIADTNYGLMLWDLIEQRDCDRVWRRTSMAIA